MNSILKIEIPDVMACDIAALLNDKVAPVDRDGYVECSLSCMEGWGEILLHQADLPLKNGGAVFVREPKSLVNLTSIPREGGIAKLLAKKSADEILADLDNRLQIVRQRLLVDKEVFIFAAHRNAVKCVHYCESLGIRIAGFIDNDTKKHGQKYCGIEVFSLEQVDKGSVVINASGRYCVEIGRQLESAGYRYALNMMEFLFIYNLPFQAQKNFRDYISEMVKNRLKILSLYLLLEDEKSRKALDSLVLYRLTLDSDVVGEIASPYDEEFFAKDVLSFSPKEVFVDGGAYDGDSFMRFSHMSKDFSRAYLFEPDTAIAKQSEQTVGADDRVRVCNCGLYSKTGELRFSSTGGMDGAISESGEERIQVVALDDFVDVPITHIKLDVEGAEADALLGARHHIQQDRPKFAIAAYHKAGDLWDIPSQIESLGGQYIFYIRHYSQTIDDSIFYAFPIIQDGKDAIDAN